MNYKSKLFFMGLLLVVLLCVSVVSAEENVTETIQIDDKINCDNLSNDEYENSQELKGNDYNETLNNMEINNDVISINDNESPVGERYFNDLDMERKYGYHIVVSVDNIDVIHKSDKKFKVTFTNSKSGETLSNYFVNVELMQTEEYGKLDVYSFQGYTNFNGVFEVPLLNILPGHFQVSTFILFDPINEFKQYNENFANVIIEKDYSKITVKKIKGTTASSILKAIVKDINGELISDGVVTFTVNGKSYNAEVNNGVAKMEVKLPKAKTYTYKATFSSYNYQTKQASSKLVVKKSIAKISAESSKNYKGLYSMLKANIKDTNCNSINEGIVKFKINGKTYNVKVKKGIAQKKIKLSKVKTYEYKAIFSSKYYTSKASNSIVTVKELPTFIVKEKGYRVKITYNEYKKLKNKERRYYMKWTGEYRYETRDCTLYKNVCYAEMWSSNDWSDTSWVYHKDNYKNKNDWKHYGYSYSSYDDGHYVKYFNKYKKHVKKTVKRKVYMTVSYYKGLNGWIWTKK